MADKFLVCEGDTDREVLRHLPRCADYEVLPEKPKPCTAKPRSGDRTALMDAVRLLRLNVPRVVLALDLNSKKPEDLFKTVEAKLASEGIGLTGVGGKYEVGGTRFTVVPVGIPGNPELDSFGINSHAVDDFLVLLLGDQKTYDEVVRSNNRPAPDHARALSAVRSAAG